MFVSCKSWFTDAYKLDTVKGLMLSKRQSFFGERDSMRLKNIMIVVKDMEKSKEFYRALFGLDIVLDGNENVILTEGLVLQQEDIWRKFLQREVCHKNNSCELFFEEKAVRLKRTAFYMEKNGEFILREYCIWSKMISS